MTKFTRRYHATEQSQYIICILIFAVFFALFVTIAPHAIARHEAGTCAKLKKQQGEFSIFYATMSEAEMCEKHAVVLSPVRVFFEDGSAKNFTTLQEAKAYYVTNK